MNQVEIAQGRGGGLGDMQLLRHGTRRKRQGQHRDCSSFHGKEE
jgi:hypothetical protein